MRADRRFGGPEHLQVRGGDADLAVAGLLFRADIGDEGITQLSVNCTGDWDAARRAEHAAAVTLIRPQPGQRRRTSSYAVCVGAVQDDSAWEAARAAHCGVTSLPIHLAPAN